MLDPKTCIVLVPVAQHIEPETLDGLSELMNRGYRVQTLRGCSQVDLARSIMASDAMREGFEETMWIDADVVFDPNDVDKLRGHGKPLVAGLYTKKGKPEFAGKWKPGTQAVKFGADGGLLEMEYVGMGFTLIRREVYEAVGSRLLQCGGAYDPTKTIVPYFLPMIVPNGTGHDYLSEDYSLCYRARQVGFAPFADTTIKLGHAGRKVWGWADMLPRDPVGWLEIGFGGS